MRDRYHLHNFFKVLTSENEHLAKTIEEVHKTVGSVGYYIIGLHVLAGLYHHYIRHDNALFRMLPIINSKSEE